MRFASLLAVWLVGAALAGVSMPDATPEAAAIVKRSVSALQSDWDASPQFEYFERERGDDGVRTYHVLMICGTPYKRLVASNGASLNASDTSDEERKLAQERAKREAESSSERAERVNEYRHQRAEARQMLEEMPRAFLYQLVGTRRINGTEAYLLRSTPNPDYRPPTLATRILTVMRGEFWIDTRTFQWLKVTASALHSVSLGGFLIRINAGTRFELEQMPVGGGVWLPSHFSIASSSRLLLLFHHHLDEDHAYFNYRRLAR
jgi:hypothetical protein